MQMQTKKEVNKRNNLISGAEDYSLIEGRPNASDFGAYRRLIWTVIYSRMRKHGVRSQDYPETKEELFGEASIVFLRCIESWDENGNSKFSTWLYDQVNYNMMNYLNRKIDHTKLNRVVIKDIQDLELAEEDSPGENLFKEGQLEIIQKLYKRALGGWNFEKCASLFFIEAFDPTGNYNPYMQDFVIKYEEFFEDKEFCVGEGKLNSGEAVKRWLDLHIIFQKYFYADKKAYRKIQNNVRNSVGYFVRTICGYESESEKTKTNEDKQAIEAQGDELPREAVSE